MKIMFRTIVAVVALGLLAACAAPAPTPVPPPSTQALAVATATDTREPVRQETRRAEPSTPTTAPVATATNAPPPTSTSVPTNTSLPNQPLARRPMGVYAHIDLTAAIKDQQKGNRSITPAELETKVASLFQELLANPAITGLAIGVHWDLVNPNSPTAANAYAWGYLDDAFNQAAMWNTKNPTQTPKTIQLIVDGGFDSPQWLLDQIPSCDGLFHSPPQNESNCGKVTFMGYAEPTDGDVLPLPWNTTYKSAWQTFLTALAARYGSNPTFVSIAVGGPTASSTEMILPIDEFATNPQTQFGLAVSPDNMWLKLLAFAYPNQPTYQNSNQAFVDEWDNAIDMYGKIFSGITLVASPDKGGFPDFSTNFMIPNAFTAYCPSPDMDCAAKTLILSHFIDPAVGRTNAKATQSGGMKAYLKPDENLSIDGVKRLSQMTASLAPSAQILGGEQYDHPFSTDSMDEGCLTRKCTDPITPEQAEYNVLKTFFDKTPAAASFGGTPGTAPLNYLQDSYEDIEYATAHVNAPAPVVRSDGTTVKMTAQDLLNLASQKLLQIAETHRAP